MNSEFDPAMHPADIADALQQMSLEEAVERFRELPADMAAEVFSELDEEFISDITERLSSGKISGMLMDLPHDEVADIVAELSPEQRRAVLKRLNPPESAKVAELMRYPEDSAGGIMKDEFIALPGGVTIEEGLRRIRRRGEDAFSGATYVYVVDDQQKLTGVVSVRDLVFRPPSHKLCDIMNTDVRHVKVDDDQEDVAYLFTQYHYLALPVVDLQGRLVGVVEAEQVMEVLQEEATEDMQLMVGMSGEESVYTPWRRAIRMRMPWLYVNLVTAFFAAAVIALFEDTLARWTALAMFLPVIAGQGGNSGMQSLTVTIRSMALGEMEEGAARRVIVKEITMGLMNGILIGVTVGAIAFFWQGSFLLGGIVFLAMFLNMVSAAIAGVLIPVGLRMFKLDPAMSSSIFLTTITDVAGFFFFLGLAALLVPLFGPGA